MGFNASFSGFSATLTALLTLSALYLRNWRPQLPRTKPSRAMFLGAHRAPTRFGPPEAATRCAAGCFSPGLKPAKRYKVGLAWGYPYRSPSAAGSDFQGRFAHACTGNIVVYYLLVVSACTLGKRLSGIQTGDERPEDPNYPSFSIQARNGPTQRAESHIRTALLLARVPCE